MPARRYDEPPSTTIDTAREYRAVLHTEKGDIAVRLLPGAAPVTVNNFVFLAREGFYDGCTFHRVVPGFVAQTGDPGGTGRGGPGYRIPDELNDVPFEQGTVGMANAGPNTNGSQFYIVLEDAPHLNRRYTAFGRVEEGMDVARSLRPRDPASDPAPGDRIESVEIIESQRPGS